MTASSDSDSHDAEGYAGVPLLSSIPVVIVLLLSLLHLGLVLSSRYWSQ